MHALWTLDGLGKLDVGLIERALSDPEPGVRENAIRLAETRLATLRREPQGRPEQRRGTTTPLLVDALLRLEADADPRVRFQLLCTLGSVDSPGVQPVRDRLLLRDIEDEWMQTAALSASSSTAAADFDRAASPESGLISVETPGRAAFFRRLGAIVAARQNGEEISHVIDRVASPSVGPIRPWRAATLEGLASGARAKGAEPVVWRRSRIVLLRLFEQSAPAVAHAALELLKVAGLPAKSPGSDVALARAVATATDRSADPARRTDAIDLLTLRPDRLTAIGEPLRRLVDSSEPDNVRAAAARALGRMGGDEVSAFLLSRWRSFTPEVRHAAADALLREPAPTRALLSALKRGDVQPWTLDFREKRRLLMHRDPAIRDAARAILEEKPGEREAVLKRFDRALDLDGDVARGQRVFKRVCEKCHRMNGAGADVGPDLGTVRHRPASLLLTDILLPSQSIAAGYEAYTVDRISGGVESGVLRTYSPDAIVLRREEGQETIIPRQDIKQMTLLTLSLMPADLDAQLDSQQMADLIAFVRAAR